VTNLDWRIDASEIGERLGLGSLKLINDFDAIGHGLDLLREEDLQTLQEGDADPEAPIALIGAGTGLGEAFVVPGPDAPAVHSSEGGHADFAPADAQQERLLAFLRSRFGHVSWERVVSGPGLANLYDFAVADGHAAESAATRRALEETDDRPRVISRLGRSGEDANCEEAIRIFVTAFGAEAGNLALKVGARGGVFVAGGIAPELVDVLADGSFRSAFGAKGRLSEYLAGIPVRVVTNTDVGLLGAARVAASSRA
jgi:glucokinase